MSNPFTIKIFVPDGDPDGLRIIDRQSSPAKFFVFPRNKWGQISSREELVGAGVYVLVGYTNNEDELETELEAKLPTVYVGQADNVKKRIDQHMVGKDFWDRAIIFVSENKINSTHAKWLEYALIKRVVEAGRSRVDNGNNPSEPTISEAEKAELQVFLVEILQTLPIAGIKAFEKPEAVAKPIENVAHPDKDTIVVPARKEGFDRVFLGENSWYAIRISGGMLDKIRYIAGYQTAPISAITHIAEVERIEPYGEEGKYKLIFKNGAVELPQPIKLETGRKGIQSPKYTSLDKLKNATLLSEAFWLVDYCF